MGFKRTPATRTSKVTTWEFRIWTPFGQDEHLSPTLTVMEFTGTKAEFISFLKRNVLDWGQEGRVGPLMSLADVLLDEWSDNEE